MDLEVIMLSQGKSDRARQIPYNFTYMWEKNLNKLKKQNKQNRNRFTNPENRLVVIIGWGNK